MSEEEGLEEIEEEIFCPPEKKVVHKYKYGTKPQNPPSEPFDYSVVDFNYAELEGKRTPRDLKEEHTLFLIKPSAMAHRKKVKKRLYDEGFSVLKERTLWLSPEELSEFYFEHYGKPWFPKFILKMASGPILVMVLAKYQAINDLKELLGNKRVSTARRESPLSLRALFGLRGDSASNGFHGSEGLEEAAREIRFFFRQAITEPEADVDENIDFIKENIHVVLLNGLLETQKKKPADAVPWLAEWFLNNEYSIPLIQLHKDK